MRKSAACEPCCKIRRRPLRAWATGFVRDVGGIAAVGICAILFAAGIAQASCPAPSDGQDLPPEARPAPLDASSPSQGYWQNRLAQLDHEEAGIDLTKIRLLFIGDSIVERWDHDVFAQHCGRFVPLNLGISGDATQSLLWRLPRIGLGQALRPELIVLLVGTNNTYPGGGAANVAIGIGEIVRTIHHLSPASRILLLGLIPRLAPVGSETPAAWRREIEDVNRLISACADNEAVFYADPGGSLLVPAARAPQDIEADFLHPTPLGYRILSDALDPQISRLLQ
jgi:beta-glucosidase